METYCGAPVPRHDLQLLIHIVLDPGPVSPCLHGARYREQVFTGCICNTAGARVLCAAKASKICTDKEELGTKVSSCSRLH